jgi:6-phosphogluconolactonase (cycloisomerase 2 family)
MRTSKVMMALLFSAAGALAGCGGGGPSPETPPIVVNPVVAAPAYVAYIVSNTNTVGSVAALGIDAASGAVSAVAGSPFPTEANPNGMAIHPSAKFAYVVNSASNSVSPYTIDASTGALAPLGSPVPTTGFPRFAAIDPSGTFLYVTQSGSNSIAGYRVASNGALSSLGAAFASASGNASGQPTKIAVEPGGKYVYVLHVVSNEISGYSIDATTGALTSVGMPLATGTDPEALAIDPAGKFAYVTNFFSATLSMYSIDATNGTLTSLGTVPTAGGPRGIAIVPSGKYAYVAIGSRTTVSAFAIEGTTGALTSLGSVQAGDLPRALAVDPLGKFLYVVNQASEDVSRYSINATNGALTSLGPAVPAGSIPFHIVTLALP